MTVLIIDRGQYLHKDHIAVGACQGPNQLEVLRRVLGSAQLPIYDAARASKQPSMKLILRVFEIAS